MDNLRASRAETPMEVRDLVAKMSAALLKRRAATPTIPIKPIANSLARSVAPNWPTRRTTPHKPRPPVPPCSNM